MTFSEEHFTGAVTARALTAPTEEARLAVYAVTFEAAAHTDWHTHP
jgi:quercetin dioxygenase-like cupin family protein